jgi:acyl transferase domain-containing protein/acyl carrier protein
MAEHVDWSLSGELEASPEKSRLNEVDVIQPAIFAVQVALAELWRSWGIKPDAVVGHSMGEVAAAHVAGAISLVDAARIICLRSRLARRTSGRGAMAVVDLSFARSGEILAGYEDRLAVAVSNSPTSTVLSGDPDALEDVLASLERDGIFCRRVKVDYASHSPHMDALREDLLAVLQGVAPRRTKVPLYSTVTGAVAGGTDLGAEYWARNLREPVLFSNVVKKLLDDGFDAFLEISPHPILLPAIQQCLFHFERDGVALGSLRRDESERRSLMSTLASLYALGRPVEWSGVYRSRGACVALPSYPWQRERFWLEDQAPSSGRGRTIVKRKNLLIGEHIQSAAGPATHLWQRQISAEAFPFLKDHRVHAEIVLPATAYLEMALEAASEAFGEDASITIENVTFERALVLAESETRTVQIVLTRQMPARFEWQIFGAAGETAAGQAPGFARHARGEIRVLPPEEHGIECAEPVAVVRARCKAKTSSADHYQAMADLHYDYGPAFQGVEAVWAGSSEAVGQLKPAPSDARRFQAHPAFLDAALQVVAAGLSAAVRHTLVPVSVRRFRIHKQSGLSGALWAHAAWTNADGGAGADVRLVTEGGELVAELTGIGLAPLDGSAPSKGEDSYAIAWEKAPGIAPDPADEKPGIVLVFGDRSGVGTGLACQVSARGGMAVHVTAGGEFHVPEVFVDTSSCTIDPARADDYSGLLDELARRGIPIHSVVHLWSLDDAPDARGSTEPGWQSALLLVQALARSVMEVPPRLWIITRGAQHVLDGDDVAPFRAPVWGLARTVAQEHPEITCTVIDLESTCREAEIGALADELWRRDLEQQIAFRNDERFVARLHAKPTENEPRPIDSGGVKPFRAHLPETGNLSSVYYRQAARRRPAPGEVEIEVVAAGLNFRDILLGLGVLPGGPHVMLGHECAGRISGVGEGVTGWSIGDEVVALARPCLASHVRTRASLVVARPRRFDFEQAAALPIAFLTAHYALNHLGRLQRGERVLVHSATGAVGLACLQLARRAGAEIYATAGTPDKRRMLESLGVRKAMDSRALAFAGEVMEATGGEGVDVVVNSLSGEALARSLEVLRPGGRFIDLGKRDLLEGGQIPLRYLEDSRSFFLVDLSSLADKQPETCGRLLREAIQLVEEEALEPLPQRVFPAAELPDALHHMARGQHTGKVVIRVAGERVLVAAPGDPSALLRDDATYALTGGLGGIGLVVARWLVDRGARTILLVGRHAPSQEARAAIDAMEHAGARIIVEHFDVADEQSVVDGVARWARDLPPLRGLVHAAGLLDDGILLQQTPARFRSVMAPKVEGAWNLHLATEDIPLDFFVLFSSAASVFGSAGQSNYAAANQFLDALAHYRRRRGLPATSVNWGPWSEVGLAARADRGGRLEIGGMKSISPQEGLEALGRILVGAPSQAAIVNVDWKEWRASYPQLADMPFFSRVAGAAPAQVGDAEGIRLQALPAEERLAIVEDRLRQHVAAVLRLAAARIDLEQPLVTMGIDSLMAVELKSRVERDLGVAIPLLQLIKGPSLSELARSLAGSMTEDAVSVSGNGRKETGTGPGAGKSLLLSLLSVKENQRRSNTSP